MTNKKDNGNSSFEWIYIPLLMVIFVVGIFVGTAWLSNKYILNIINAMGSLATAFTFIFVICQNKRLKDTQDKQEKKQEEMWIEQKEMLSLEKYHIHRSNFIDLLNRLENDYNITFYDKPGLYKDIFPSNRIDHFNIKISSEKNDTLKNIKKCYAKILKKTSTNNAMTREKIRKHLDKFLCLNSYLKLKHHCNSMDGDFFIKMKHEHYVLNIFSINESIYRYGKMIDELFHFCNVSSNFGNNRDCSSIYLKSVMDYIFDSHRNNDSTYCVKFSHPSYECYSGLYSIYEYICGEKDNATTPNEYLEAACRTGKKFFISREEYERYSYNKVIEDFYKFLKNNPDGNSEEHFKSLCNIRNSTLKRNSRSKIRRLYTTDQR